jgi:hypothetical protein
MPTSTSALHPALWFDAKILGARLMFAVIGQRARTRAKLGTLRSAATVPSNAAASLRPVHAAWNAFA